MDKDFVTELKGSANQAIAAKQQIEKYFKRYGESDHPDAKKHQLMFASKILYSMTKCDSKHVEIYCRIITDVFSNHLQPEASAKYWTQYINCILSFFYVLVVKKDFENALLIFKNISSYTNKLQSAENGETYVNIYCYHLVLQNMLKSKNAEVAQHNATAVLENLTQIFKEILETNIQNKFQYPDILEKAMQWLFPRNSIGTVYQFLRILPREKVKGMFESLFILYGRQKLDASANTKDIQKIARFTIETTYSFLQIDIMDKMQLQLGVMLLSHCCTESRLQTDKSVAELFLLLYDYIKLLCSQNPTLDFQSTFIKLCERFLELFNKHSKIVKNQPWFGDLLVLIFYMHSQLQNNSIFNCFWKQMFNPQCYKSMFKFFMELMKLSPCITADTKLYTTTCCTRPRKHVILLFAQVALTGFILYCQNVSECDENEVQISNKDSNLTNNYKETIHNTIIFIIKNALDIIVKMDCINSNSQEIEIILTRFKQATLNCKTHRQAGTCISILECLLKIQAKISSKEWPLLLRRLYKTATQLIIDAPQIGRDIQMCYIASMLHESISEVDIGQIRTQISIFYTTNAAVNEQTERLTHEMCLTHMYYKTSNLLRPNLTPTRKKLLHWLESQHILKYHKTNTALLHSLLKSSQSHYDFVIVTKSAKLQTYAMAKILSLYESFKKTIEFECLKRLDLLTFGHVCVMILNETNLNQKFQIDSKDLCEEQLELLLQRDEMEAFTIHKDIKRLNLVLEAFKAFEDFFEKFDSEIITMDDAIIDWESFMDDLASLALCLQLSGYMEQCSQIWLLHYKCSRLLQDGYSSLRGLAFFCEYSEQITKANFSFKLTDEFNSNFPFILQCLENFSSIPRQTYQNYILLVMLQIAYYYARLSRYSFAQMLLQYVELRHAELPDRQGRYDIIMATADAIKFRLLWKHFNVSKELSSRTKAEKTLFHRCLLRYIEETLDRFYDFSYISSNDGLLYSILILGLVQELAECTANRLCDNFINSLFIATCKSSLLFGLALRFVQILSMWMRLNLQMECVDKAQIKLKIIEYVLGIKSLKEVRENSVKHIKDIQSSTVLSTNCADITPANFNPGMEAIRKLAQVQLSPIKTDKLQLSPYHRNFNLKLYLKPTSDLKKFEQIEWMYFMVGCLSARLYFLVEEYDQLEEFYEYGIKWLERRQNEFYKKYESVQLMALQHYVNFLRARRKYEKAQQFLVNAIDLCENMKFNIDVVYYINFQLQMINTRKELNDKQNVISQRPVHNKLRRQLQFNISPEYNDKELPAVFMSSKKSGAVKASLHTTLSSGCSSAKKPNIQLNKKTNYLKQKTRFEICEDFIECTNGTEGEENPLDKLKINIAPNEPCKTPKVTRKMTRSAKVAVTSTVKSTGKIKRPQHISAQPISIDLTDSPESSPSTTTPLLSSSPENFEDKTNLNTNELITQMQNLEIKENKKSRNTAEKSTKNERVYKTPLVKKVSAPLIVLDPSPAQISRTRHIRDKTPKDKSTKHSSLTLSSARPRRQPKIISDPDIEDDLCLASTTTATTSSATKTRKRPKKIV